MSVYDDKLRICHLESQWCVLNLGKTEQREHPDMPLSPSGLIAPSGALSAPLLEEESSSYRVAWFQQNVDHFNAYVSQTFMQRYLVDDSAFKPGGPIFAFTGAEGGDVTHIVGSYATPAAVAKSLGGCVLYMEARYFGDSIPAEDVAAPEGIGLLSVENILRDYVALLSAYRDDVCGAACTASKVVTFGGSMAGTLSALMRLRAPWLVDAAWASSTPLLGFVGEPSLDQYAWRRQVTRNWDDIGSAACVEAVRSGFTALSIANASEVALAFGTCEAPFEGNRDDVRNIAWSSLESNGEFVYPASRSAIPAHCKAMVNGTGSKGGLAVFAALLNRPGARSCLNLTKHATPTAAGRAWNYLACTEIIHPIGADNASFFPPGEWTVAGLNQSCMHTFGVQPRPTALPTAYGLQHVRRLAKTASRIMFAYGTRDPWAQLGVGFHNLSASLPVVAIDGGSHCADVEPRRADDTPAMLAAREQEGRIMRVWLS